MENEKRKYWFFGSKLNTVLLLVLIILMVAAIRIMLENKETYLPIVANQNMTGALSADNAVVNKIASSFDNEFIIKSCGNKETLNSVIVPDFYLVQSIVENKTVFSLFDSKGSLDKKFIFSNAVQAPFEFCETVFDGKYDNNFINN